MRTPDPKRPLERPYNLATLSDAGYETTIVAAPEDRARIAVWAGLEGVNSFAGKILLKRLSPSRFAYKAALDAEIVQRCVVTLDPVLSRLSLDFARTLELVPKARGAFDLGGALDPASGDDDVPEEIDSPRYDLAGPLLEEFSLAIDPYPHAPGVAFETPAQPSDAGESPFARLKLLKGER